MSTQTFDGSSFKLDDRMTSQKRPYDVIDICYIDAGETRGRLSISIAPGKKDTRWNRDLPSDLKVIKDNGVQVIVCLLQSDEMKLLGMEDYFDLVEEEFILYHLPIRDRGTPNQSGLNYLIPSIVQHLNGGHNVLVHCRGGLGRAGTICACCLGHFGYSSQKAIEMVRDRRPGAIQTRNQEKCVARYCNKISR